MNNDMTPLSMKSIDTNINKRGYLIALEGLDGSGKTTLSSLCVQELRKQGYNVEIFRNSSGYTGYWQSVMEAKRDMNNIKPIPGEIDQSLHAFEFLTYVRCTLSKLLELNDYVFCDRYIIGKMVLADMDTGISDSWPKLMLNEMLNNGTVPKPDLTFYLHVSPEIARQRILARGGNLEVKEEMYMLQKAYTIFMEYEKNYEMKMINCEQNIQVILKKIIEYTLNINKIKLQSLLRTIKHNGIDRF